MKVGVLVILDKEEYGELLDAGMLWGPDKIRKKVETILANREQEYNITENIKVAVEFDDGYWDLIWPTGGAE